VRRGRGLGLLAALLAAPALAADPLALTVTPIDHFALLRADEPSGPLAFAGGVILAARDKRFGGLSGIDFTGRDSVLLLSDRGAYVRARLVHENGVLVGATDATIGSIFKPGAAARRDGDMEDFALDPSDRMRGVIVRERQANAMLAFDLVDGAPGKLEPVTVGAPDSFLLTNRGLESVTYAPPASPLAGGIVTVGEVPLRGDTDFTAWVAGEGTFTIGRSDGYDVSSARFLPNGDLVLLERRFGPVYGIGMRLRRVPGDTLALGAKVDAETLLEAGLTDQIDNMEGLAVSTDDDGRTVLTLVSDDNFSVLQRTLILQFALDED
jgi:hypothetical protein